MQTLKMYIAGYDETTHSLLVSFASDETRSTNPQDYPAFAFQPIRMWPDVSDVEEIKKRIAVSGLYHAQMQAIEETFVADQARVNALKALVGQQVEFAPDVLAPQEPQVINQSVTL